jgi:zinc protease
MVWLLASAFAASPFPMHEEVLPSGDTLVVVEDHRAPVVFFRIDIPVGRHSPWGWDHDVRTAWDIQLYDPERSLRKRADALAVNLNLTQSATVAQISVSCLSEDLEDVLDLVDDVLHNTDFETKELKRWKKGRKLDARSEKTEAGHQGSLAVRQQLFTKNDPRRRPWETDPPMERDPSTLAATRDAILAQPGRIVGVSGDVSPALGRRIAEALLPAPTPIDGEVELQYRALRPADQREDTEVPLKNLTQVYFRWTRPGLTWEDPDAAAALVAGHVLAGHAHARLGQRLRYDEGATYGVNQFDAVEAEVEALTIYTFTRTENAGKAEGMLQEELARFHADGITEEELADAVTNLSGSEAFRLQGPWSPMGTRMWELRHGLPAGTYERVMAETQDLSLDQVNDFIGRFYDPAAFTMVKVVPK